MARYARVEDVFADMPATFRGDRTGNAAAVVQFDLSGDGAGRYWIQVQPGTCRTGQGEAPRAADATVRASAADWLRVSNGEVNPVVAYFTGRLKIDGPMELVLQVARGFRAD